MGLQKTFESPLDCKEIKQVNPKGNLLYSLEGLMLRPKFQCFDLMQRADSLEKTLMLGKPEDRRRRGRQRMRWLDGIADFDESEFEQTLGNCEGQGSLVCCSSWGLKELETA